MEEEWKPTAEDSPFSRLGGSARVRELVERFYDAMERQEPRLAQLHRLDDAGKVSQESRERFALFLIGWLGGPQDYIAQHGHPRLRMRHHTVPIGTDMRDAWMRSMRTALDELSVVGPVRDFLESRLAHVADFLRNQEGP